MVSPCHGANYCQVKGKYSGVFPIICHSSYSSTSSDPVSVLGHILQSPAQIGRIKPARFVKLHNVLCLGAIVLWTDAKIEADRADWSSSTIVS